MTDTASKLSGAGICFETCMDIFDWYDAPLYEYINHILRSKCDAEARVRNALPLLQKHAAQLVAAHRGAEDAYPEEYLNTPA